MANYCPNCGISVDSDAAFCKNCGTALNSSYTNQNTTNNSSVNTGDILGTLVAVSLVGGLTRQLYFYNGRYFLDPYCRRPFVGPRIIGPHHPIGPRGPIGMRPHHMGGMHHGGHRGPGGFGGPRGGGPGGFGGPRGGGPGGHHGGGPRGH